MCSSPEAGSHLRLTDLVSLNARLESHREEEEGRGVDISPEVVMTTYVKGVRQVLCSLNRRCKFWNLLYHSQA
jgi:hypothetical protein